MFFMNFLCFEDFPWNQQRKGSAMKQNTTWRNIRSTMNWSRYWWTYYLDYIILKVEEALCLVMDWWHEQPILASLNHIGIQKIRLWWWKKRLNQFSFCGNKYISWKQSLQGWFGSIFSNLSWVGLLIDDYDMIYNIHNCSLEHFVYDNFAFLISTPRIIAVFGIIVHFLHKTSNGLDYEL